MVVAGSVFAALLRYHHELLSSSFEEKTVLRIQAVHPRALRDGGGGSQTGRMDEGGRVHVSGLERNSSLVAPGGYAVASVQSKHVVGSALSHTGWTMAQVSEGRRQRHDARVNIEISKSELILPNSPTFKERRGLTRLNIWEEQRTHLKSSECVRLNPTYCSRLYTHVSHDDALHQIRGVTPLVR